MINLEYSVIVKAPVEKVWNFMSDFDNTPQWDPEIVEVKGLTVITMEPLEVGKTRLTRSVRMDVEGLLKLIQPFISYKAKGFNVKRLDNVKRLVEAQSLAESI